MIESINGFIIFSGYTPNTTMETEAKKGAQTKVFNDKRRRIPMVTAARLY